MAAIRNNIISDANARDKYIQGVKLLKNDFLRTGWPNTYDIFVIWHYNAMMTLTPVDEMQLTLVLLSSHGIVGC
jgi:tyrosinase